MYRSLGGDMVFPPCRSGSNCDVIRKGIYLYHHGGRFFLNFQSLIRNGDAPPWAAAFILQEDVRFNPHHAIM